jgi:hypothetical protein
MTVDCPNCGHHLFTIDPKTSVKLVVNTEQKQPEVVAVKNHDESSAASELQLRVNRPEASDAQQSGGALTTVEKIKAQGLRKEGYFLARIRQLLRRNDVSL